MWEKISMFIIGSFISGTIGLWFTLLKGKRIDILVSRVTGLERELIDIDKREQRHYELLAEKLECGFKSIAAEVGGVKGELKGINARLGIIEQRKNV